MNHVLSVCCISSELSSPLLSALAPPTSGDPADVARSEGTTKHLTDWKDMSSLAVLNLVYDVTSPDHVAMVITERGNLPCTSVPVVLRVSKDEEIRHHDNSFGEQFEYVLCSLLPLLSCTSFNGSHPKKINARVGIIACRTHTCAHPD